MDNTLQIIRDYVKRYGVEIALIVLTRDGYVNWAAGYKIQLKDIRPEWKAQQY